MTLTHSQSCCARARGSGCDDDRDSDSLVITIEQDETRWHDSKRGRCPRHATERRGSRVRDDYAGLANVHLSCSSSPGAVRHGTMVSSARLTRSRPTTRRHSGPLTPRGLHDIDRVCTSNAASPLGVVFTYRRRRRRLEPSRHRRSARSPAAITRSGAENERCQVPACQVPARGADTWCRAMVQAKVKGGGDARDVSTNPEASNRRRAQPTKPAQMT